MAYKNSACKADIKFTGRVDRADLVKLIGSAKALTLVSKLEGFGIPILEAYFCDVPVICSDVSSMPEVAGKGAILVNHNSIESIADAMKKVEEDPECREKLLKEARIRRQKFSWDKTADLLWQSIENLIKK